MTNNEATEAAAGKAEADILERLRKWANDGPCRNWHDSILGQEAATEIASLRGYREMDKAHVQACENAMMREKARAETAERDLAKAMEAISAARLMSNIMFNLSQRGGLNDDLRNDMSGCQKAFDVAARAITGEK